MEKENFVTDGDYNLDLYKNSLDILDNSMILFKNALDNKLKFNCFILMFDLYVDTFIKYLIKFKYSNLLFEDSNVNKIISKEKALNIFINEYYISDRKLISCILYVYKYENLLKYYDFEFNFLLINKIIAVIINGFNHLNLKFLNKDLFKDCKENTINMINCINDYYENKLKGIQSTTLSEAYEYKVSTINCEICFEENTVIQIPDNLCFFCEELKSYKCKVCNEIFTNDEIIELSNGKYICIDCNKISQYEEYNKI